MNEVPNLTLIQAERAQKRANHETETSARFTWRRDLPVIRVLASELPRVVDEAEDTLIESSVPIFTRAGSLVRPIVEAMPTSSGRLVEVARLSALGPDALTDVLAQSAIFQRYDERRKAWANIDPPAKVAATLLAREGQWRLPSIAGIITTPTLRPDGSLLAEPGYDPETRLYLMLDDGLKLPPIAEKPSQADAEAALELLSSVLTEFPFVGPVDRAVALSGIITAVIRPALPVAPMHGIRASTAGTGKSYLVDVISAIATGRACSVIAAGKTEEETEKRLGAMLLDGAPVISIDNVNGELGGDMLCQMTERPLVRARILGTSKAPEIECRATIFATGNNLTLVGDMTRRAVLSTLDAGIERPEFRDFASDPVARVIENRGAFVAAVITIVRAFKAAGSPKQCGPIGSYGAWSQTVRSALLWLGEADPVASMEQMRDEDPELVAISELLSAWERYLSAGSPYTAVEVEQLASEKMSTGDLLRPDFRDLLMRQAGSGPVVSTKRLGRWLTRIKGRVVHGKRLDMMPDEKRGHRFLLVQANPAEKQGELL